MNPRHRAREVALQILYRYDLAKSAQSPGPIGPRPIPNDAIQAAAGDNASIMMARELSAHFDHFQVPEDLRAFAGQLVSGTLMELAQLDAMLETHASNWKVARMGSVDRSLLRMAVYELKHFPKTDASVVIDEAVELGKQFGAAETPAFVNGILDAIKTTVRATG
jgi:transcription antitermination factor NusB